MALIIGGKNVSAMYLGGKGVKEAWLNGSKVWPNSTSIEPIIIDISKSMDTGPVHFSEFDGNMDQPYMPLITHMYYPQPWASTPASPTYVSGCCGRKALHLKGSSTSIFRLHDNVKAREGVTVSILVYVNTLSTYGGFIGGTIFGLATSGFGYAVGWGKNIQGNKICAEVYGNQDKAAAAYSPTAMTTGKWYHIMAKLCVESLLSNPVYAEINVNGEGWTRAQTYPGTAVDYSNTDHIYLGRVLQSGTQYLNAYIQDFVIWGFGVSTTQLEKIVDYYRENGVY